MKLGKIAFRNIFRNKRRSLLSGTAILVAAMSIVMLFSLFAGMTDDIAFNLHTYVTGALRLRHRDFTPNERLNPLHLTIEGADELVRQLEETPEVSLVSPRITFPVQIYRGGEQFSALGTGVDFRREEAYQDLGPRVVRQGRLPREGAKEALLGYKIAEQIGVRTGDKITVLSSTALRGTNALTLTVTGIAAFPMAALNGSTVLIPLGRAQNFLRMPDQVQEILVKLREVPQAPALAEKLRGEWRDRPLEILSWTEMETTYSLLESSRAAYNIFAVFFFLLGSSVILNTTMMVIFERTKEIGTLSAMGMTGRDLVRLFFTEAFVISLIASLLGVFLGAVLTGILNRTGLNFGEALEGVDFEMSSVLYPRLNPLSVLAVFVYSVGAASLTVLFPAARAGRIQPAEALKAL